MKIAVVGSGAIGSLFAGAFAKSKEEVWLLDKHKERAAIINREGINIEGASNFKAAVKAAINPQDIGKADLIIISVKSYNTKEAIKAAKPLIADNSIVLTLQNGIGNLEIISEIVGQDKVIAAVTNQGATYISAGHIRHAGKGDTAIGRADTKISVEMRRIREAFNKAGFPTKISKDIKGLLWSKLIINAGINALSAITRLPNGKLIEIESARKILREAVSEALKVAKRKRIKIAYDDPLAKTEAVCEATAANLSSMLQDVLKKKRTEIDFINGVIVRQGQELGIPTPVNSLLADLIKTIESTY